MADMDAERIDLLKEWSEELIISRERALAVGDQREADWCQGALECCENVIQKLFPHKRMSPQENIIFGPWLILTPRKCENRSDNICN